MSLRNMQVPDYRQFPYKVSHEHLIPSSLSMIENPDYTVQPWHEQYSSTNTERRFYSSDPSKYPKYQSTTPARPADSVGLTSNSFMETDAVKPVEPASPDHPMHPPHPPHPPHASHPAHPDWPPKDFFPTIAIWRT